MTGRGSNLLVDSNLNSAACPTSCGGFITPKITALTVWNLKSFKLVTDTKFEPSKVTFLRLIPSTGVIDDWQGLDSELGLKLELCSLTNNPK